MCQQANSSRLFVYSKFSRTLNIFVMHFFLTNFICTCNCTSTLMSCQAYLLRLLISSAYLSSLFLNVLKVGASTTYCGSLLQSFTIRWLKKFFLMSILDLIFSIFLLCHFK